MPSNDVKPRGNADTAAEYLTAAADGMKLRGLDFTSDKDPARQLAAMEGIGWALLAVCDQLADLADATTDNGGQLAELATAVDGLAETRPRRTRSGLTAAFGRLTRTNSIPWRSVAFTAPQAVIVRQALADAAAWRAWRAEGRDCASCAAADSGKCAEHTGDEDLADAYEAMRARLPGGDGS